MHNGHNGDLDIGRSTSIIAGLVCGLTACRSDFAAPVCAESAFLEEDAEFVRGLEDFEQWSGEPACVPTFFVADRSRPAYLEGVAAACEAWDRRHGSSEMYSHVFTGAGVSGHDVVSRRREDFVRSCESLASYKPSLAEAEELFCGRFPSERLAVIRMLFPEASIPVEAEPEIELGVLVLPEPQSIGPVFAASNSILLVAQQDSQVDPWTLRAFLLEDLSPLWTAPIDGFSPALAGGLEEVLVEDGLQMWRADAQGLEPMPHPGGWGFGEDRDGWWAVDFIEGEAMRWRFGSDLREPIGSLDPGFVISHPDGPWIASNYGGAVQIDTGAQLEIEEQLGSSVRLTVRGGIGESYGGFTLVKRQGEPTRIRGASCGAADRPVTGPLRVQVRSTWPDPQPGQPRSRHHRFTRLASSPGE